MQQSSDSLDYIYVLSRFPHFSETFIKSEIDAKLANGNRVVLIQLRGRKQDAAYNYIQASLNPFNLVWSILRNAGQGKSVTFSYHAIQAIFRQIIREPSRVLEWLFLWLNLDYLYNQLRRHTGAQFRFHFLFRSTLIGHLLNRKLKYPAFVQLHTSATVLHPKNLNEILASQGYRFQAISFNCKAHFERNYALSNISIVRQSVNLKELTSIVKSGTNNRFVIVCAGRFVEKKGFLEIIACVDHLPSKLKEGIHLQIIGDGPLFSALKHEITKRKLEPIIELVPKKEHTALLQIIANANLLIVPSIATPGDIDGIPTVLIEAMLLNTRVLTTSIGGIPELIEHGKTGYIFEPTNPNNFVEVFSEIINVTNNDVLLAQAYSRAYEEYVNQK